MYAQRTNGVWPYGRRRLTRSSLKSGPHEIDTLPGSTTTSMPSSRTSRLDRQLPGENTSASRRSDSGQREYGAHESAIPKHRRNSLREGRTSFFHKPFELFRRRAHAAVPRPVSEKKLPHRPQAGEIPRGTGVFRERRFSYPRAVDCPWPWVVSRLERKRAPTRGAPTVGGFGRFGDAGATSFGCRLGGRKGD